MFNIDKFKNINEFIKFLESKGDETFDYCDIHNCCFAQWAKSCGAIVASAGGFSITVDGFRVRIPHEFELYRPNDGGRRTRFSDFLNNVKTHTATI